jgi:hypothetical protein
LGPRRSERHSTRKQVDLLLWVRDGCPEGVYDNEHHRISAAALRRRSFLSISGHGPSWRAKLTEAGEEYLTRTEGPDPPIPRQANVSVTRELIDNVIAGGGKLVVSAENWREPDSVDYKRRARLAEQHGKVPVGKMLAIRNLPDGELEIELVDGPTLPGRESWTPSKNGHLVIETEDERFWFRLREGKVKTRGPWEQEVEHYRNVDRESAWWRDRELPGGAYDANADGKLELDLFCGQRYAFGGRQSRWGDRQRWSLEERLPEVLQEIEIRAAEATLREEEKRQAAIEAKHRAEEEAKQREIDWKVHLKEAWQLLFEERRAKELRSQAAAWAEARELGAYCDAVERTHGDDAETQRWLEWARGFIKKLDPLGEAPSLPEITEAPEDELQQYMPEGWSVQGAEYSDPRKMRSHFGNRQI